MPDVTQPKARQIRTTWRVSLLEGPTNPALICPGWQFPQWLLGSPKHALAHLRGLTKCETARNIRLWGVHRVAHEPDGVHTGSACCVQQAHGGCRMGSARERLHPKRGLRAAVVGDPGLHMRACCRRAGHAQRHDHRRRGARFCCEEEASLHRSAQVLVDIDPRKSSSATVNDCNDKCWHASHILGNSVRQPLSSVPPGTVRLTLCRFKRSIRKSATGKACGPDGIPTELYRIHSASLTPRLRIAPRHASRRHASRRPE